MPISVERSCGRHLSQTAIAPLRHLVASPADHRLARLAVAS
jgi:hypothetical protein